MIKNAIAAGVFKTSNNLKDNSSVGSSLRSQIKLFQRRSKRKIYQLPTNRQSITSFANLNTLNTELTAQRDNVNQQRSQNRKQTIEAQQQFQVLSKKDSHSRGYTRLLQSNLDLQKLRKLKELEQNRQNRLNDTIRVNKSHSNRRLHYKIMSPEYCSRNRVGPFIGSPFSFSYKQFKSSLKENSSEKKQKKMILNNQQQYQQKQKNNSFIKTNNNTGYLLESNNWLNYSGNTRR